MLYLQSHCGPSWAGSSVDVLARVVGDISVHVSLLSWEEKYFSNRCLFCFCVSRRPFRSRFGGIFRQTDLPFNSLPDVLVCAQGLRLTDSCEARGRLAVPVVVGLVDKSVLVTP